jgi:peptidoglycan/xylan/chitin deacetylase (PgdA/CDA1 family)
VRLNRLCYNFPVPSAPTHYTSLKPFRDFFATGMPCLTYHKIAPRPPGVRIKGLYLNPRLFQKQMGELAEEGFTAPPYGQVPNGRNGSHTFALSFDDGFVNAFQIGLKTLAQYKFHAVQFLVADRIGQFNEWEVQLGDVREPLMDASQIREWMAAGHQIGAHTLTHPFLTRVSIREAREEIFASKKKLEDLFGVPIQHFCYPYGDRNQTIRDMVREAGYTTACTTDFGVNTAETPPLELRRIMARHRSISIKAIKAQLAG